ncbi:MAG TPA: 5-(carboxyamino)imidazole ribonucleotide mutase [Clostridiales bacterium UBA8153]|nr:5-(carboxyamino)imidazole ribonucleotide mutase [Clostridiales bacterium UBA8153]
MSKPRVGIVMGSDSDLPVMQGAAQALEELGISFELTICSAHRTPERVLEYGTSARQRGLEIIIAGAAMAAHLPGMMAAATSLPVIGVPLALGTLSGVDALHSIVQMPTGVPVATVGIGNARNAGLLAVAIIASHDAEVAARLEEFRARQNAGVYAKARRLEALGYRAYLDARKEESK